MSVEWLATFAEAVRAKKTDRNGWPARGVVTAIAVTPSATHVGVIWRDDSDWKFLSLQADRELVNKPLRSTVWCVSPAVEPELLTLVSEMCRRVLERNELYDIRFGFRFDNTRFLENGQYVLGDNEAGLTCATFVLALFRSAGVNLLRVNEWPKRSEDAERQRALIESFANYTDDLGHVAALQDEIGVVRFRPEEVAAASAFPSLPCSFETASKQGEALLEALRSRREATAPPIAAASAAIPDASDRAARPKKRRTKPM